MTIVLTVSWGNRLPGDAPPLPAVSFATDCISLELDSGVIRSLHVLLGSFVAGVLPPPEARHPRFREFHPEMGSRGAGLASLHEESPALGENRPPRFLEILERLIQRCDHLESGEAAPPGGPFDLAPGGDR